MSRGTRRACSSFIERQIQLQHVHPWRAEHAELARLHVRGNQSGNALRR